MYMSSKNDLLIDPIIKYPKCCCPECGGQLYAIDSEMTFMALSDDGYPINEETVVKCRGVCSACGHKLDMFRWEGGYRPYSRILEIDLKFKRDYAAKQRVKSLNESVDITNPFMIKKE